MSDEICPNCGFSSDLSPRGRRTFERRIEALEARNKMLELKVWPQDCERAEKALKDNQENER